MMMMMLVWRRRQALREDPLLQSFPLSSTRARLPLLWLVRFLCYWLLPWFHSLFVFGFVWLVTIIQNKNKRTNEWMNESLPIWCDGGFVVIESALSNPIRQSNRINAKAREPPRRRQVSLLEMGINFFAKTPFESRTRRDGCLMAMDDGHQIHVIILLCSCFVNWLLLLLLPYFSRACYCLAPLIKYHHHFRHSLGSSQQALCSCPLLDEELRFWAARRQQRQDASNLVRLVSSQFVLLLLLLLLRPLCHLLQHSLLHVFPEYVLQLQSRRPSYQRLSLPQVEQESTLDCLLQNQRQTQNDSSLETQMRQQHQWLLKFHPPIMVPSRGGRFVVTRTTKRHNDSTTALSAL